MLSEATKQTVWMPIEFGYGSAGTHNLSIEGDGKGLVVYHEGRRIYIGLNDHIRLCRATEVEAQPGAVVADWLQSFPPEWDRHPWANYAYLQPSSSMFDGITFMWYYFEYEPEWGEKSYNWVDGKHGYANPVTRAPLNEFFDVRQTLQRRPAGEEG